MPIFRRGDSSAPQAVTASVLPFRSPASPTPIVAASENFRLSTLGRSSQDRLRTQLSASKEAWQEYAWEYTRQIGEINYALTMVANLCSRARLYPAVYTDPGRAPEPVEAVTDLTPGLKEATDAAMRALSGESSPYGHDNSLSGLVHTLAWNLLAVGEAYLVCHPAKLSTGTKAHWQIHSIDEVIVPPDPNSGIMIKNSESAKMADFTKLPRDTFVGRIWRPDPRYSHDATSAMRALLPLCSELVLLNQAIQATAQSRLNAGALYLPDGLSASQPAPIAETDDFSQAEEEDEFEQALMDALTTPIMDPGAASSVVPIIIRGPQDLGGAIKQFTFDRSFDAQMVKRAEDVLGRILAGLDVPKDMVQGLAAVKYCASADTEILTRDGWKTYDQLSLGEDVLTLNHDTGMSQWQPATAINTFSVVDEPMLSIDRTTHHSLTTLDHRWPVLGGKYSDKPVWKTSATLAANDRIIAAARCSDIPADAKYTDDFVELVAWFWTEGSSYNANQEFKSATSVDTAGLRDYVTSVWDKPLAHLGKAVLEHEGKPMSEVRCNSKIQTFLRGRSTRRPTVQTFATVLGVPTEDLEAFFTRKMRRSWAQIAQSERVNPEETLRIRQTLTRLFGPASSGPGSWSESHHNTDQGFVQFLLSPEIADALREVVQGPDKIVSTDFIHSLTYAQLNLFIDVSVMADGHERPSNGSHSIVQAVPERLDPFDLACVLAGRRINRGGSSRSGYRTGILSSTTLPAPSDPTKTITTYTGTVWCPTTANSTWFARKNGSTYFTGNSNAVAIGEEMMKTTIEPMISFICDALTNTFLHPYLQAFGFTEEQAQRVILYPDTTVITNRPNRSTDAMAAYDRHALSGKAMRAATGFAESDAPSRDETLARVITERGALTPELTEALLRVIAPDLMDEATQEAAKVSQNPLPPEVAQALGAPPSTADGATAVPPEQQVTPEAANPSAAAPSDNTQAPSASQLPPPAPGKNSLPPAVQDLLGPSAGGTMPPRPSP